MIDSQNPTDFGRSRAGLEELTLWATMLPTKPAQRMAELLETMLGNARLVYGEHLTPFDIVRLWIEHGVLDQVMYIRKMGEVDLRNLAQLEAVHGIGPKMARFVVLHSVAGSRCIPVDTHWLKELHQLGYPLEIGSKDGKPYIPAPNARTHPIYEGYALKEVDKHMMSCAEYDLQVWKKWNGMTVQQRRAA